MPEPPADDYSTYYELKKAGLERVLGPMHELVGHAVIPFQVGGPVDMYRFPQGIKGTAFATMDLIERDGSGPQPSRIGTYELVAFTKHRIDDADAQGLVQAIELRIRSILSTVARYSYDEELNPLDTCEVPAGDGEPNLCLVLDEWKTPGVDFRIGGRKHGLLLCIEIFRAEMEFAMQNGSAALLRRLWESGDYPYSDMSRESVA